MHGLAVGVHGDQVDEASFDEADGVVADGGWIEVFGFGIEEGHGGSIDSGAKGSARHGFGAVGQVYWYADGFLGSPDDIEEE